MKNFLKTYLKNRPAFYSLIRPKEAELFHRLLFPKKPILDFGCKDGFFAKLVFEDFGKIDVGLDVDKDSADEAKKSKIYNKVVIYDGKRIPYSDNHFETVISNCVFEHIHYINDSLSEINRVLKPKGSLVCTVMTDNWEKYFIGSLLFGEFYKKWMRKKQRHSNLFTEMKWSLLFKKRGFRVVKVVGYMNKNASRVNEILHYLSSGSLFTRKFFGKWVIFPWVYDLVPIHLVLKKLTYATVSINKSAALFYILEKV